MELQRQIRHKFCEPIWYMLQKLRTTMDLRDGNYQLDKIVELYEGFFESVNTEKEPKKEIEVKKRGRGSQKQSKVLVMASTIYNFKTTKFRYVRMLVVDNLRGKTIEQEVKENISPGACC